jgi:hypothetical protein
MTVQVLSPLRPVVVSSLPGSPAKGDTVVLSSDGHLYTYTGAAWVDNGSTSGGSDPWTVVKLASDFPTSSAAAVDITGLSMTPAASKTYLIEAMLMLRTATATVGARPGIAWPTGMTDGVAEIRASSSAAAQVIAFGNIAAAVLCANTGLVNTTQSWPARLRATLVSGVSPSGTFRLQLATETAGTTVTVKAGSWLRWREL